MELEERKRSIDDWAEILSAHEVSLFESFCKRKGYLPEELVEEPVFNSLREEYERMYKS